MRPDCSFCAIASGTYESIEIVAKTAAWVAFFPLNPATPGHTLVIPRAHVEDLWQVGHELAGELMSGVVDVGNAIRAAVSPEGMNLITSAGTAAEQTVFHLHLHVVPRWQRDGIDAIWPPKQSYRDETLTDVADRIRAALR
jgi:histidine triad (HIT) family protein